VGLHTSTRKIPSKIDFNGHLLGLMTRKTFIRKARLVLLYYSYFFITLLESKPDFVVKAISLFTLSYIISPFDLIPDFIPIIGLIDELLIVPILIWLTLQIVGKIKIKKIHKIALKKYAKRENFNKTILAFFIIPSLWLFIVAVIAYYIFSK
tara:strand:+ start:214 stop:669 length:456 start_codon:yes stop_codon:yes gene_type:complete